jgi:CheY-like chemotaxis protein
VEDQDPVRVLLGRQLQSLGYTVLEAGSGAAARRIAADHRGDLRLLLTDVILEGMNGRELYDLLARESLGIKVLYMSGYTKGVLSDHGVAGESVDFIQKPFDLHALAVKVREILDRR